MPRVSSVGALALGAIALTAAPTLAQPESESEIALPRRLTAFEMRKAEALLRDRLSCLGCHELDGEGGRMGPDLSSLQGARRRAYVDAVIADPATALPGTIMPRIPMRRRTRELIVSYLLQREAAGEPSPSLERVRAGPNGAGGDGPAIYARHCAACHGAAGDGDGPNAEFLPTQPTAHADAGYMSTRTDDALFDAVFAGGYIMGRSNRMPPFGFTLTREEIHGLVRHMRDLCGCRGPDWSRDGR